MSNLDLITPLLARETRPLDLGGYADAYAGNLLQVNVNAPGVVELAAKVDRNVNDLSVVRATIGALFDLPMDKVSQLDDSFVIWLYSEGLRIYTEYHDALKKK